MHSRVATTFFIFLIFLASLYYVVYLLSTMEEDDSVSSSWSNISAECICDNNINCYKHPSNPNLCGKCFHCIKQAPTIQRSKEDLVFALSSNEQSMNGILVLVASIHAFHPKTKILIYDSNLSPSSILKKQLVSIRNVDVFRQDEFMEDNSVVDHPSQIVPYCLSDAISRSRIVVWLNDDLEVLSDSLEKLAEKATQPLIRIGSEYVESIGKLGFVSYFPRFTATPKNFTAMLVRENAHETVNWLVQCAASPGCWDCTNRAGIPIDCLPFLLSRLSSDHKSISSLPLPSQTLQHQRWNPPYCDAKCIALTSAGVLFALIVTIATVLVMFSRISQKRK